jgi:hypothetical protein
MIWKLFRRQNTEIIRRLDTGDLDCGDGENTDIDTDVEMEIATCRYRYGVRDEYGKGFAINDYFELMRTHCPRTHLNRLRKKNENL